MCTRYEITKEATKMGVTPSPFRKAVWLGMLLFHEIVGAILETGHEGLTVAVAFTFLLFILQNLFNLRKLK